MMAKYHSVLIPIFLSPSSNESDRYSGHTNKVVRMMLTSLNCVELDKRRVSAGGGVHTEASDQRGSAMRSNYCATLIGKNKRRWMISISEPGNNSQLNNPPRVKARLVRIKVPMITTRREGIYTMHCERFAPWKGRLTTFIRSTESRKRLSNDGQEAKEHIYQETTT